MTWLRRKTYKGKLNLFKRAAQNSALRTNYVKVKKKR